MKRLIVLFLFGCSLVAATPTNNPVVPPSEWRGYGTDWMHRSERIGTSHVADSLEDGWLVADTVDVGVLSVDSAFIAWFGVDSLTALWMRTTWGTVDSLLVVSDSAYFAGPTTFDSTIIGDSAYFSGSIRSFSGLYGSFAYLSSLDVTGNSVLNTGRVSDSLVVSRKLWAGDSSYVGNDAAYFAGDLTVDNVLSVDSVEGQGSATHLHVLDSLLTTYIGSSTSISATNNVSANDLMASDSLIANTVNSTYTVRAGGDITGHASSVYLSRLVSRNGYVYTCYSPIAMALYGAVFTLLGTPALAAASSPTYVVSDFLVGLYYLDQSPDFSSASGWVLSGTSISGGKLNKLTAVGTGTATSTAISNYPIIAGATYLVHVDVDSLSAGGSIAVSLGGTAATDLTAEGADQWLRIVTANNSGLFSLTWDNGETGVLDNVYVYRLAGDFIFGGEVWNQTWKTTVDRTVFPGEHIITVGGNNTIVTLPELAECWNSITSAGREIVIENQGPTYCVVTTPLSDDAYNAIMGGDTLHLGKFETVTLRAVTGSHWAVQR